MTEKRRQEIYRCVFSTTLVYHAVSLPLNVEQLCRNMGIELRPLSKIITDTGLTKNEVFKIWGNRDGPQMSIKLIKLFPTMTFRHKGEYVLPFVKKYFILF